MTSVLELVRHYQKNIQQHYMDEQKLLKSIDKLFHLNVTQQHLQETGVGRTVNVLCNENDGVGHAARDLLYKWKCMVAAEESESHTNGTKRKYHSSEEEKYAKKSKFNNSKDSSESKHSADKSSSKEKQHITHREISFYYADESSSSSDKKHKVDHSSKHHGVDKHRSSSQKTDSETEKHGSSTHKSDKSTDYYKNKYHTHKSSSHRSEKDKLKSTSEKQIAINRIYKHKSKESSSSSSSKDKSSSSDENSKGSSSSSRDMSSSHRSDKKHSSSNEKSNSSAKNTNDKKEKSSEKKSSHKSNSSSQKSTSLKENHGSSFAGNIDTSTVSLHSPSTKLAPLAPLPPLETPALSEILPNHKPRPPPKFQPHFSDKNAMSAIISSKKHRTKVYSGNKICGKVPTLNERCIQIIQENIDALEFTGGVPYEILKPVLEKATAAQLFNLEHFNPYLLQDTDVQWQKFCEKNFRNKKRQEMESWREMYLRCQEEQEIKLRSLTAKIRIAQEAKKTPIKQTKMAYVDTVVKPPRDIARKQAQHGTAFAATASPAARVSSLAKTSNVLKGNARLQPAPPASLAAVARTKQNAPLTQKALQVMREFSR